MKSNESKIDRVIRAVIGVVLLFLGLGGVLSGAGAVAADLVGVILLATAALGFCPLYWALKLSTNK